jgi:hypothetical protein
MKGAVSLASNTADGLLGTTTVMTRSVGRGIAYFAKDEIFLANRERLNQYPDSLCGVVARPFRDVGNGIYCGVVGVVRLPYQDVRKYGCTGLFTGLGKGLAGLGAKPVIGVLDAVTHTGDGIRSVVKSIRKHKNRKLHRRRYPSLFGIDGRLLPYNPASAMGAYLLFVVDSNLKEENETFRKKIKNFSDETTLFRNDSPRESRGSSIPASQWPLMKTKRRRSIIDPNSEIFSLEGVVFTAKIPNSSWGEGQRLNHIVAVITTKRLILINHEEADRNPRRSPTHIQWQCAIKDLDTPILNRTETGGCSLSVTNQRNGQVYVLESMVDSPETLQELYSILSIMLYQYDPTAHLSQQIGEMSDLFLALGPWQYSHHRSHIFSIQDMNDIETLVVNNLENSSWKIEHSPSDSTAGGTGNQLPKWLQQDKKFAIDSHQSIQTLLQMCQYSSHDNSAIVKSLLDGCMTSEEFRIFVEKDLRFGSAIHQTDDVSLSWLQGHNLSMDLTGSAAGNRSDSNLGKTINKIGRRLRSSVSVLPFFKQRSDSQISELSSTANPPLPEPSHPPSPPQESPRVVQMVPELLDASSQSSHCSSADKTSSPQSQPQETRDEEDEEEEPACALASRPPSLPSPQRSPLPQPTVSETAAESVAREPSDDPNLVAATVGEGRPAGPTIPDLLAKIQKVESLMSTLLSTPEGAAILAEIAKAKHSNPPSPRGRAESEAAGI